MDMVTDIIEVFFMVFILRTTFRIIMSLVRSSMSEKSKYNTEYKTDNKEEVSATNNKWIEELEKIKQENKILNSEKVVDEVCGATISKEKAYIVARDDKRYYFCSWECREKFIKENPSNESRKG